MVILYNLTVLAAIDWMIRVCKNHIGIERVGRIRGGVIDFHRFWENVVSTPVKVADADPYTGRRIFRPEIHDNIWIAKILGTAVSIADMTHPTGIVYDVVHCGGKSSVALGLVGLIVGHGY